MYMKHIFPLTTLLQEDKCLVPIMRSLFRRWPVYLSHLACSFELLIMGLEVGAKSLVIAPIPTLSSKQGTFRRQPHARIIMCMYCNTR